MRYHYSPETLELITGTIPNSMENTLPFLSEVPPSVSDNEYVLADPVNNTWVVHQSVIEIPVPESIKPRQARLQLIAMNKLDDVPVAIASLPEAHRKIAEVEWEYATYYERNHPFIDQMGAALNIDMDQFFIDADKL